MAKVNYHADYEKIREKNHNKGIRILILLVIAGYAFFFLSPILFHERPEKSLSALNTETIFLNGRIFINEWKYSPKQNMSELCCTTQGINPNSLKLEASCNYTYRSKNASALKMEIAFSSSDYFVAYIYDIPEDWYCIAVRGQSVQSQPATENSDGLAGSEEEHYGFIYTCVDDVETVTEINTDKKENQFIIERNEKRISLDEKAIQKNLELIESNKKTIEDYESDIKTLKGERTFQIPTERDKTDAKIAQIESTIDNLNSRIRQLETANANLRKEISDYETIIWQLGG